MFVVELRMPSNPVTRTPGSARASEKIGTALLRTRGFLRREVPLCYFVPGFLAIQCARRLFPPFYYCCPVNALAMLYLVSVMGWLRAGLLFQVLKLADCVWFVLIKKRYAATAEALLDPSADSAAVERWLPRDVSRLLGVLDVCWRSRIAPDGGRSGAHRLGTVALLGSAWATDEMVTLYFVATRCGLGAPFFALCWAAVLVCTAPEFLVKARTIQGIVNAAAESDFSEIARALKNSPPWLIAAFALFSGTSTLVVHTVHLRLIWETTPKPPSASEVELADRAARRRDLLANQRRALAT